MCELGDIQYIIIPEGTQDVRHLILTPDGTCIDTGVVTNNDIEISGYVLETDTENHFDYAPPILFEKYERYQFTWIAAGTEILLDGKSTTLEKNTVVLSEISEENS